MVADSRFSWVELEMSVQDQKNGVREAVEEAQGTISETAEKLKGMAADAGGRAHEFAREAGRQASAAAQTAYGTSNEVLDLVEGVVRENVWTSVLIAGALGYGLACLVKSR